MSEDIPVVTETLATHIDVLEFLDLFGYTVKDNVVQALLIASAEEDCVVLQVTRMLTKGQVAALRLMSTPIQGPPQ